jgi:hypothetical protein
MDFQELKSLIRDNRLSLLVAILVITPAMWTISKWYYDGRIDSLDQEIRSLQSDVDRYKALAEENNGKKQQYIQLIKNDFTTNWDSIKTK